MFKAPVYSTFYVAGRVGDIPVHFHDKSGETQGWDTTLKEVEDLREIYYTRGDGKEVQRTIYVEVEHDLEYPIAEWDCEEIVDPDPRFGTKRRRFCEATLVATPKAALF